MRIFDCFTFFNEIDLLKIRLEELKDAVDCFVLVEATQTHRGRPKPLYFQDCKEELRSYANRIAAFVVDDMPEATEDFPWPRERHQRKRIGDFLATLGCRGDDLILISDVDEIPRASVLPAAVELVDRRRFAVFVQKLYRFYLNNVTVNDEHLCGWCGTVAFRYRELERITTQTARGRWCSGGQLYRYASWSRRRRCLADAGWHFTSMGGTDALLYKLQSFAHHTMDDPTASRIESIAMRSAVQRASTFCHVYDGTCVCGCTWKGQRQTYTPIRFDSDFAVADDVPEYLKRNKHEFPGLFRFAPEVPPPVPSK